MPAFSPLTTPTTHHSHNALIATKFPPQATLTYAKELQEILDAGAKVEGALPDTAEASAEGTAFFRTISPLVAQVSEGDAEAIAAQLAAPTDGIEAQASYSVLLVCLYMRFLAPGCGG